MRTKRLDDALRRLDNLAQRFNAIADAEEEERFKIVAKMKKGGYRDVGRPHVGLPKDRAHDAQAYMTKMNPGKTYEIHPDPTDYGRKAQVGRIMRHLSQKGSGHF